MFLHRLLLLSVFVLPLFAGDEFYVTQGQAEEYLLSSQLIQETPATEDYMIVARDRIFEHTLLALAWDSRKTPLSQSQFDELSLLHTELAIRLTREAWTRVRAVEEVELLDYIELAKGRYLTEHILVEERDQADSLKRALAEGSDFADLATLFSQDPGSAELGGALGSVEAGQTVMEFERTLFSLRPGETSGPVKTPFGWHLIRLVDIDWRESETDEATERKHLETLERDARREAELAVRDSLWKSRKLRVYKNRARQAGIPGNEIVAQSRDTVLTRADSDRMIAQAFGDRVELMGENLADEFLRFWIEQDAWFREALDSGIFESRDVLDRMDLHERLLKSRLLVAEELAPSLVWTEQDLENFMQGNPAEFLSERSYDLWHLGFRSKKQAENALKGARRRVMDPAGLGDSLGVIPRHEFLTADRVRTFPTELRSALVGLDPKGWSDVLEDQAGGPERWKLYYLVERPMPGLDESSTLRKAVEEALYEKLISAEISRVVYEMKELTGWKRAVWIQ